MKSKTDFQQQSYENHANLYKDLASGGSKSHLAKTWFENDTVDAWRHQRMYQLIDPIINNSKGSTWLTVGDGRYGKEARYLSERGCNALATDISEYLLKDAKESGYISDYRIENAENLSFEDCTFDYVFCKESYHHFPRPFIALYEMLRVTKKAAVLIEPNDNYITDKCRTLIFRQAMNIIKRLLGRTTDRHSFEEAGNYVFSISRREMEKVALGLNYKTIATKGINDFHCEGVELEKLSTNGPLQKKVKKWIKIRDILCKLGLMNYRLISVILFKETPSDAFIQSLKQEKYEIIHLPENPYV